MNAVSVFKRAAACGPERWFAFDKNVAMSYREADVRSDAIAAGLEQRGASAGAHLGLSASDSVDLIVSILGAWKAGSLPSMIDPRTGHEQLPYFVEDVDAKVIAADPQLEERLRAAGAADVVPLGSLGEGGPPEAGQNVLSGADERARPG
jgi:acyl-CoA synthetase (AMP-forming)/AMP-acid ligase II